MFEQDYLMKMIMAFYQALFRSLEKVEDEEEDPQEAADTLDEVVGNAVGMDGASLLSLAPESIPQVLELSGTDPRLTIFVARSLLLASEYLAEADQTQLSGLRAAQGRAIAEHYGFEIPENLRDLSDLKEIADQTNS